MKKILSLVFTLVLCLSLSSVAFAVVGPSESFYAADYANVLSSETEELIVNTNGALEAQCKGAQFVVVTVRYLDGMYCDEYAYKLFNEWGIGSKEYNNGMLLLLATEENKAWLAYGLGLSSSLGGGRVDEMLDEYFWADFDNGDYDAAVNSIFSAVLDWFSEEYSLTSASDSSHSYGSGYVPSEEQAQEYVRSSQQFSFYNTVRSLARIAITVFILISIFGGTGSGRGGGGGGWLPWFLLFNSMNRRSGRSGGWNDRGPRGPGGFGGGGFGGFGGGSHGGFGGGGFGGGMGHGGGGFGGGGGGRR